MARIIKLTEEQLRDVITSVIRKESAKLVGEQEMSELAALPTVKGYSALSCIDPSMFKQKSGDGKMYLAYDNNKAAAGAVSERVVLYSDGTGDIIKNGTHTMGKWSCGNSGVEFRSNQNPKAVEYLGKIASTGAAAPKKTVFVANEKFPLKFGQKGQNIKAMQKKLGFNVQTQTGQFWKKTEAAIKSIAPEYNRKTGVTPDIWNKIMGSSTSQASTASQQGYSDELSNLGFGN